MVWPLSCSSNIWIGKLRGNGWREAIGHRRMEDQAA
jgi:hypothetical protein